MQAAAFTPADADAWDELVARAPMSTFLHSRRFLAYHGDRLADASLLFSSKAGGALRAVLPAAIDPRDPSRVVSHPGATFGGLVHDGLHAERVRDALLSALRHYAQRGLRSLHYKPVPHIYHRVPSGDDVWALADLGATRVRCGLSAAIDLSARRPPAERRVRSLHRARRAGIEVATDPPLAAFWPLLEATLERRHGARPVHTLAEIELLRDRFPETIRLVTGRLGGEVVAGVVLFAAAHVHHVQYTASSEAGMRTSALDAVVERCIAAAADAGARYFDFGTSMAGGGPQLEYGLHRYKAEFGGGGVVYETYESPLVADGAR
jgi:CelD/BcsL family acetyltransferase involved in cellulose biosynthesis